MLLKRNKKQLLGVFALFCHAQCISATTVAPEVTVSVCGGIEAKRTKGVTDPITFNTRAYLKLNQTHWPSTAKIARNADYMDRRCTVTDKRKAKFENVRVTPAALKRLKAVMGKAASELRCVESAAVDSDESNAKLLIGPKLHASVFAFPY